MSRHARPPCNAGDGRTRVDVHERRRKRSRKRVGGGRAARRRVGSGHRDRRSVLPFSRRRDAGGLLGQPAPRARVADRPRRRAAGRGGCGRLAPGEPRLREGGHVPRGLRGVRCRVLRVQSSRSAHHGPPAPGISRDVLGGARERGPRPGGVRGPDRRLRRIGAERLPALQPAQQPRPGRGRRSVPAPPHRQRQGLSHHPRVLLPGPEGPERRGPVGLLHLAGGRPPRGAEPVAVRVRHGARGRG